MFQFTRLTRGATPTCGKPRGKSAFQFTRLTRGATHQNPIRPHHTPVSIHAPHARRDQVQARSHNPSRFQFTRLTRGATNSLRITGRPSMFQFTRLTRGATKPGVQGSDGIGFNSRASREARPHGGAWSASVATCFNSRASREARQVRRRSAFRGVCFNSRASREARRTPASQA